MVTSAHRARGSDQLRRHRRRAKSHRPGTSRATLRTIAPLRRTPRPRLQPRLSALRCMRFVDKVSYSGCEADTEARVADVQAVGRTYCAPAGA